MKITLNISPCPNDTFMFDALLNGRIDTEELDFQVRLADIEELNRSLLEQQPQVSKMSYAVYPLIAPGYKLLSSGSALGYGNGPLLVSKRKIYPDELSDAVIAVPGQHTTANKLLAVLFPEAVNKKEYLFSDVMEAILSEETDAGVLIHETRFLFRQRGLKLVADLGQLWEQRTALPIPLGGIVVSRELPPQTQRKIDRLLRNSIAYAFEHPNASRDFVCRHARETDPAICEQHIRMFVNEFSLDLGENGKKAVTTLLEGSGFTETNGIFV